MYYERVRSDLQQAERTIIIAIKYRFRDRKESSGGIA